MDLAAADAASNSRETFVSGSVVSDSRTLPIRRLYGSHLLAQFGDRLWQFAVPILFISVWTDTVLPSAIFQFLLTIMRILFVPAVGRRVDTTDRLKLVSFGTFGQNGCMFISGALLLVLYYRVDETNLKFGDDVMAMVYFVVLILVGIVGDLFNIAGKLGVEKDWVVVIADEEVRRGLTEVHLREERLTDLNTKLRRIDLLCKIVAPLSFGLLVAAPAAAGVQQPSLRRQQVILGTVCVCLWSLMSTFPIYWAWRSVYYVYVDLQSVRPPKKNNPFVTLVTAGSAYVRHPVFAPSVAFCCLFFTVLSDHHPLTTAFLQMDGVSSAFLGAARGAGAFTGMLGTFIFPRVQKRVGLVPANIIFAWAFVGCIVPISMLYISDDGHKVFRDYRAYFMLGAIVFSRVFLWGFDLANVKLMQDMVEVDRRGEISGMQAATCNVFEFVMAILGLFFTSRASFRTLVFASAGGVTCAATVLTLWATCRKREEPSLEASGTFSMTD